MRLEDIEKLAELAKIELTSEEKQALLKDLDSILGYVNQIKEVEVEDAVSLYDDKNTWREDDASGKLDFSSELIKEQFPDSQDGFVKVKKIL